MSAVLVLEAGGDSLKLSPGVASRVVLSWLQNHESPTPLQLTVEQAEALAETLQPGWERSSVGRRATYPSGACR